MQKAALLGKMGELPVIDNPYEQVIPVENSWKMWESCSTFRKKQFDTFKLAIDLKKSTIAAANM